MYKIGGLETGLKVGITGRVGEFFEKCWSYKMLKLKMMKLGLLVPHCLEY